MEQLSARTPAFARNPALEKLLQQLNGLLCLPDREDIPEALSQPLLFVVGCPRSGSTLLLQWLAASRCIAYPSNLMARFYQLPHAGALIQQMLTGPEYAFRDEMADIASAGSDFSSALGKTSGFLAPNEFHFFWRRFFSYGDIQLLPEEECYGRDYSRLHRELALLLQVVRQPFACKGLMFNWNLPFLAELFPSAVFLHIERQPLHTAQSLLQARQLFFGDRAQWYSFKPPEYAVLQSLDPLGQVAGQVHFTRSAVRAGLAQIPPQRQLTIDYRQLCRKPDEVWQGLRRLPAMQEAGLPEKYPASAQFRYSDSIRLAGAEIAQLDKYYRTFSGESIFATERQECL